MDHKTIQDGINKLVEKLEGWTEGLIKMVPNLLIAIMVLIAAWIVGRWIYQIVRSTAQKTHFNEAVQHLLANISRILILCLGIFFALAILNLEKTVFSLLAGVGVIGLALGFAFQDLAANFIAGLMIAIRAPMKIGDVVKISGIQGTVEDIRLRDTLILNFDGQHVFIPNKDFTSNYFTNYSSNGKRKIRVEVGIGYENDPAKALKIIKETISSMDDILSDPAPAAYVNSLGASSVDIEAHMWIKYPGDSFLDIRSEATQRIKKDLEADGFNIPFPIRTLDLSAGAKEHLSFDKKSD